MPSSNMTDILVKNAEETQGRWPCEDRGRDWSLNVLTSQGKHRGSIAIPEAKRKAWNRFCPRSLRENMALMIYPNMGHLKLYSSQ